MDIEPTFPTRRTIKRKKQFDDPPDDSSVVVQSVHESISIRRLESMYFWFLIHLVKVALF
jgi:hypothetical protein